MSNRPTLLTDLQKLLRQLETNLRRRCDELPELDAAVKGEYEKARAAERTAFGYEEWRADYITQIAAAWVLSGVFVRFLEDNLLIDPPKISGPGDRLGRARDEYTLFFRGRPTETAREYLLNVFDALAKLPGGRDIFGEHNPIHEQPRWRDPDDAERLREFFQKIDPTTDALVHDFTQVSPHAPGEEARLAERDAYFDTRFLGDLYQDLSEAARKKYALLQTPEFVEEFILDRTMNPAIDEFGLKGFRMFDPACGSGHFLLGGFRRLFDRLSRAEEAQSGMLAAWPDRRPILGVRNLPRRGRRHRRTSHTVVIRSTGKDARRGHHHPRPTVLRGSQERHGARPAGPDPFLPSHPLGQRHSFCGRDARPQHPEIPGRFRHWLHAQLSDP